MFREISNMQKSLLDVYLGKVAAGESAFIDKLCAQLTDRLCYIPAIEVNAEFNQATVQVVKITKEGRSFVPLFTHERRFKSWSQSIEKKVEPLSLLGGDLCAVLGGGTGVLIDPGAENSVELPPEVVAQIASQVLSIEADRDFAEDFEEEEQPMVAAEVDAEYELPLAVGAEAVSGEVIAAEDGRNDDSFDPFAGSPPGIENYVAAGAAAGFGSAEPTQAAPNGNSTALRAYEALLDELGSAKTCVTPSPLLEQEAPGIEPQPKKTGLLGFFKKVVGQK